MTFETLYTSGQFAISKIQHLQKIRFPRFSCLSHNHASACGSKCWNICTMPRSLSQTQRMLMETLLEVKTPQAEIANRTWCSIPQVKKMAKNKRIFGTVIRPKIMKQGRPRTFTHEIVEVCSNSVILEARVGFLNFADWRDFLNILRRTPGCTWTS